jgi:hypothetical protein
VFEKKQFWNCEQKPLHFVQPRSEQSAVFNLSPVRSVIRHQTHENDNTKFICGKQETQHACEIVLVLKKLIIARASLHGKTTPRI